MNRGKKYLVRGGPYEKKNSLDPRSRSDNHDRVRERATDAAESAASYSRQPRFGGCTASHLGKQSRAGGRLSAPGGSTGALCYQRQRQDRGLLQSSQRWRKWI